VFFRDLSWDKLLAKEITPPFIPDVSSTADTKNIDITFLKKEPVLIREEGISPSQQENFQNFTYVAPSGLEG